MSGNNPGLRTIQVCPHCGSTNLVTRLCATGPHHAWTECPDCTPGPRWLKWESAPLTPDSVRAFVMPLGEYKGQTLEQIARTGRGRERLRWMANDWPQCPAGIKRKVDYFLSL